LIEEKENSWCLAINKIKKIKKQTKVEAKVE
jgi:hypothetical protein